MAVPRSVSGAKGATVTSHWYSRGLRVSAAIAIAQRRRAQAHCRCAAAAADAAAASDEAPTLEEQAVAFSGLMDYAGASGPLELRAAPAGRGLGLFATAAVPEGGVLLSVPRSLCIAIDTDAGSLTIPEGDWPRLGGGIARPDEPLPWDLLQGLALLDATAGDGDRFWEAYADNLLPQPGMLTLPMCWEEPLLAELQHADIAAAARAQQERLRSLLPDYSEPLGPGTPSYLQWGFGCVRSRALQLGASVFGMVPFADVANHADDPSADIKIVPADSSSSAGGGSSSSSSSSSTGGYVQLVARRAVAPGDEVSISYSGTSGHTNQRWMAQYGFAPAGGNAADRLTLVVPDGLGGASLRMSRIEDALGSTLLMGAARGESPYLLAALRSLPLLMDNPEAAAASDAAASGVDPAAADAGRGLAPATADEQRLAGALLQQLDAELAACVTTLQEDEEALADAAADGARATRSGSSSADVRLVAAVRYRLERKKLMGAAQALLRTFTRD